MQDPDRENQGSKFTAEDGGEIRSRAVWVRYCNVARRGGAPSGPLVYGWQRDDGNMEKYYHTLSLTYRSISVCRCIFFSTSPLVWSASEINTQKFICLTDLLGLPASFIIWILDSFVEIKSGKKCLYLATSWKRKWLVLVYVSDFIAVQLHVRLTTSTLTKPHF